MSGTSLDKFAIVVRILLYSNLLGLLGTHLTRAQESPRPAPHKLVIGDLIGRTDIQEVKILTRQGRVPVFGSGDSKPFEIVHQTPNEIVLRYHTLNVSDAEHPTQIVYRLYKTERALISALILDQVDFAVLENEDSALEVQNSNENIRPIPITITTNTVKLTCYNLHKDVFKSRNVRLALAYGVNRNYIIKKLLGNKADLARGPFNTDSQYYSSRLNSYRYNPKKAIKLLHEAGWRDTDGDRVLDKDGHPLSFQLYYAKGLSLDEAIVRRIKIDLNKIGVYVEPKPLEKHAINRALASGNFDAVLMDYTFANNVQSLLRFFSAKGPDNYMGYNSHTFERYVKFYHQTHNAATKKTLIQSMQNVVNKDQPVNFLYFKWLTHYMVNVKKFSNVRDREGNIRPFEEWAVRSTLKE